MQRRKKQNLNVSKAVTAKTWEAVKRWDDQRKRVEQLKGQLEAAKVELADYERQVGIWLCPDNAKEGEAFSIWVSNGLLNVVYHAECDPDVFWRQEPTDPLPLSL